MSSAYRTALIPRWVWVIFVISALLILLVALSIIGARSTRETVVTGPPVQTGNPADYINKPVPTATPTTPPASQPITTPPNQPTTTPGTPPTAPSGLPQSFTFDEQTWQVSNGPITLDVQTTGQLTGDDIIYVKPGDTPPYDALYLETKPNSGRFYKYVPAVSE